MSKETADSAGGGLIDVSCQKCGSILPAVSAHDVLNELRDALEDEVGELFSEEPRRELQTSAYLIGGQETPSVSSPGAQSPAFSVFVHSNGKAPVPSGDVAASAHENALASASPEDAASTLTTPLDAAGVVSSAPEQAKQGDEPEEAWAPAAAQLDSLISEEFENAAARTQSEGDDDLLVPPEIKKKVPSERSPSPAFDADFLTDPALRSAREQGARGPLLTINPSQVIEAPRRSNGPVIALAIIGLIAVLGLLSVIIVLLLKNPGNASSASQIASVSTTQNPSLQGQSQQGPQPSNPAEVAGPSAGPSAAPDAGAHANAIAPSPDAAGQGSVQPKSAGSSAAVAQNPQTEPAKTNGQSPVALAQAGGGKTSKRGLRDDLFDDDDKPAKRVTSSPRSKAKRVAKTTDDDTVGKKATKKSKEAGKKNPPVRKAGSRPSGCDPLIYPDPMDCPRAAPPGKAEILEVVRAHLGEIDACAKKQFAVDPALASGTIIMIFWIRPTGKTAKVGISSDAFKGSVVGHCLQQKISRWSFGAFDGRSIGPIKFPFRLRTQ